jgi:hypothetical protein
MKKYLVFITIAYCIGLAGTAGAGIVWQDPDPNTPYQQFRFDVAKNQGTFGSEELPTYPFLESEEFFAYDPANSYFDPYDSIAEPQPIVVFDGNPEQVRMSAMAKGPDGGVAPPNGLVVQGYVETLASNLTLDNRVDSTQQVTSFVSRRFTVDKDGNYTFVADLSGLVNFAAFENGEYHKASYSVSGSVALTKIVGSDITNVQGFPISLSDTQRSKSLTVPLVIQNQSQQNVTYQLTVSIQLNNQIVNFDPFSFQVFGVIDGSFQLGTAAAPFRMSVEIMEGGGSAYIPSLLPLLLD